MNNLNLKVNTDGCRFMLAGAPEPDEYDGTRRVDRDGRPMSRVSVMIAGASPTANVISVRVVTTADLEKLVEFAPVDVKGLAVRYWEMKDRSGLSFTAETIRPLKAAEPAPRAQS